MSSHILVIPAELTEHALVLASPCDVANFAQTCRSARALVYEAHDQHLWRRLFLEQSYDDPRDDPRFAAADPRDVDSIDWKRALQTRVRLMRVLRNWRDSPNSPDFLDALAELVHIARNAPYMPAPGIEFKSKDLAWIANILKDHPLWCSSSDTVVDELELALSKQAADEYVRQAYPYSELWCLLGWRASILNKDSAELIRSRTAARAFVYDMRNYTRDNLYGPYRDRHANINWKHIESAIAIIQCNLMDLGRLWIETRPPVELDAIRAYSAPGVHRRDPRDWAGVEGTWRRYVCFMDYRDLFTFNYSRNAYNPRFFEDDEFQEATRLIELTLRITRIGNMPITPPPFEAAEKLSPPLSDSSPGPSAPGSSSGTPPPAPSGSSDYVGGLVPDRRPQQMFPIIHFSGESHSGNENEAKVKGSVRMTPDGNVRWRFVSASIHDGYSQWSSEGVQIGAVCSAAGIIGTWTGVHHEEGESSKYDTQAIRQARSGCGKSQTTILVSCIGTEHITLKVHPPVWYNVSYEKRVLYELLTVHLVLSEKHALDILSKDPSKLAFGMYDAGYGRGGAA